MSCVIVYLTVCPPSQNRLIEGVPILTHSNYFDDIRRFLGCVPPIFSFICTTNQQN